VDQLTGASSPTAPDINFRVPKCLKLCSSSGLLSV
jgi:hypothetical protein